MEAQALGRLEVQAPVPYQEALVAQGTLLKAKEATEQAQQMLAHRQVEASEVTAVRLKLAAQQVTLRLTDTETEAQEAKADVEATEAMEGIL